MSMWKTRLSRCIQLMGGAPLCLPSVTAVGVGAGFEIALNACRERSIS